MTPGDGGAPRPLVVVMCRAPVPGRAKTRLAPALDRGAAAALALALLLDVVDATAGAGADREVCVADPRDLAVVRAVLPPGVAVAAQPEGDLGERLAGVAGARLAAGRPAVVVVGSDCPLVGPGDVAGALRALDDGADLAVSPAGDGGYSLIALSRPHPGALRGIPWGGPGVLAATRRRARQLGLALADLAPLDDVDRPGDLGPLRRALDARGVPSPAPRTWHALAALAARPGAVPLD